MKNYLYVLFNVLSCRYGDVMAFPSDGFAVKRLLATKEQNPLLVAEHTLFRFGEIGIADCSAVTYAPVAIPWTADLPIESAME